MKRGLRLTIGGCHQMSWLFIVVLTGITGLRALGQPSLPPGPSSEQLLAGAIRLGSSRHAQSDFSILITNRDANREHLFPLVDAIEAGPAGAKELSMALRKAMRLIREDDIDWNQYVGLDQPSGIRFPLEKSSSTAVNASWILCRAIAMTQWRNTENPTLDTALGREVAESVCELLGTGWGDGASHAALKAIGEHSVTPLLTCLRDADQRRVVSAIHALLTQGYPGREADVYAAAMLLREDRRPLLGPGQRVDTVGKYADLLAQQADASRYQWDVYGWPRLCWAILIMFWVSLIGVVWRSRRWHSPCVVCGEDVSIRPLPRFQIVACSGCRTVLWYVVDRGRPRLINPEENQLIERVVEHSGIEPEQLRITGTFRRHGKSQATIDLIRRLEEQLEAEGNA